LSDPGLAHAILADPLLGRDPVVMACLSYYRHGYLTLEPVLLLTLRELVRRNNALLEENIQLHERQTRTFLLPAMN
jgi:hypothetical protein